MINDILLEFQKGNTEAFTEILTSYKPLIESSVISAYNISEAKGLSGIDYEDLRQESTIALFLAAESFKISDEGVTFGLYAKICIKNRLTSYMRKFAHTEEPISEDFSAELDPEQNYIDSENYKRIEEAVRELFSDYEKAVFKLYVDGKSYAEIAQALSKTPKSVDNAITRIKSKLAESLL